MKLILSIKKQYCQKFSNKRVSKSIQQNVYKSDILMQNVYKMNKFVGLNQMNMFIELILLIGKEKRNRPLFKCGIADSNCGSLDSPQLCHSINSIKFDCHEG